MELSKKVKLFNAKDYKSYAYDDLMQDLNFLKTQDLTDAVFDKINIQIAKMEAEKQKMMDEIHDALQDHHLDL